MRISIYSIFLGMNFRSAFVEMCRLMVVVDEDR